MGRNRLADEKLEVIEPKISPPADSKVLHSPFPTTFGYEPWIFQSEGTKEGSRKFINPFDGNIEVKGVPEMDGKLCLGFCRGEWFLLLDTRTNEIFFMNFPNCYKKVHLPSLSESFMRLGGCIVSSSPVIPKCLVIFVGKNENFILFCRPNDHKWIKLRYDFSFSGQVVLCKGNIYALLLEPGKVAFTSVESLLGMPEWTFTSVSGRYSFADIPYNLAVPHGNISYNLVVSHEDLFIVRVCFNQQTVLDVGVWLLQDLDTCKPSWRKVGSIDRRIFFLSEFYSYSFTKTDDTMKNNCIYVLRPNIHDELLYEICLENQIASLSLVLKDATNGLRNLCWVVPSRARSIKRRPAKSSCIINSNQATVMDCSRTWTDLPAELVELLITKLSVVDCIYLQASCKAWHSPPLHFPEPRVWSWLIHFPRDRRICGLLDPLYGREYVMKLDWLDLDNAMVPHFSREGWVLVSTITNGKKRHAALLVINPFTKSVIKLPCYYHEGSTMMFSSVPTSPDFVVFMNSYPHLLTWRPGETAWTEHSKYPSDFITTHYNRYDDHLLSLEIHGELYCLNKLGNLAIYKPDSETWLIADSPEGTHSEGQQIQYYLMEMEGELICVAHKTKGLEEPNRVFRWVKSEMVWKKIEDLGDWTLFLGYCTSIARPSPLKGCANKIYFPRYDEFSKLGGYYSLDTNLYRLNYFSTKGYYDSIWIEPNLKRAR